MTISHRMDTGALSRSRRWAVALLACCIALTLLFIWGNSLLSREQSKQSSDFVEVYVRPVLRWALKPLMVPSAIDAIDIRKLAHFVEYMVLGCQLGVFRYLLRPARNIPAVRVALLPLLVAMVDEGLQFISSRGPSLRDVGIDWLGALTGLLFAWGLCACVPALRREGGHRHA